MWRAAVVSAFALATVCTGFAGGVFAHNGGQYWTTEQASAAAPQLATVAGEASCYGTDRPLRRAGGVLFRHFFCFIQRVTTAPGGSLGEPIQRFELHVLASGKAIGRNHVRRWGWTPGWIDDRPTLRLPLLRGKTFAEATRVLEKRGFSPLPNEVYGYRVASEDFWATIREDVLMCDQKVVWGRGQVTLLLYLGYPRCVGPPYLPPRVPRLVGLRFKKAAETTRALGLAFDAVLGDDPVDLRGHEMWFVCRQDPRPGARRWSMAFFIARRC